MCRLHLFVGFPKNGKSTDPSKKTIQQTRFLVWHPVHQLKKGRFFTFFRGLVVSLLHAVKYLL